MAEALIKSSVKHECSGRQRQPLLIVTCPRERVGNILGLQGRNKLTKILVDANKNQKDSLTLVRWLPGEAASWVWSGNDKGDTHDGKSSLSASQLGLVQRY